MGNLGSALTHFQQQTQQTYISFPPNSDFSPIQHPLSQSQIHSQHLNPSVQQPYHFQSGGRPNRNPGSFEVTLLHLCDPRVSTCYGCGQPIRSAGMLIPPPSDIVVLTKIARRDYIIGGEKRQGKLGNVYFHSYLTCIRSKYPNFFPSLLYVTSNVRNLLLPVHRQQLVTSLGFSV